MPQLSSYRFPCLLTNPRPHHPLPPEPPPPPPPPHPQPPHRWPWPDGDAPAAALAQESDAAKAAAADVLAALMAQPSHGPRVSLLMGKLLPPGLVASIAEGPPAAVLRALGQVGVDFGIPFIVFIAVPWLCGNEQ
jgi:hypothetical protein